MQKYATVHKGENGQCFNTYIQRLWHPSTLLSWGKRKPQTDRVYRRFRHRLYTLVIELDSNWSINSAVATHPIRDDCAQAGTVDPAP